MKIHSIDFHPTEPWVLGTTHNGSVYIWNYMSKEVIKYFKVSDMVVRVGRFIARKNWIIAACDDTKIYVFNLETMDLVETVQNAGFIRDVLIHPIKPWLITAADDNNIRVFDWDSNWHCELILEGHKSSVMSLAVHPVNPYIIVSGSFDGTVQEWNFQEQTQSIIRVTHERGVVWVGYQQKTPPQLISASENGAVKIMKEVGGFGLKGHNVGFYYPFSLVITGSREGLLRLYSSNEEGYAFEKSYSIGGPISAIGNNNEKLAYGNDAGLFLLEVQNTVEGFSIQTEMLPFKSSYDVDQFSSVVVKGNKYTPALNGVMDEEEFKKCVVQIKGNSTTKVKKALISALPAGGAFYFLYFFMPFIILVLMSVAATGVAAAKLKQRRKELTLPLHSTPIDQVNANLRDRHISFKKEGKQVNVHVKTRGALPEPETLLIEPYDDLSSSSSSIKSAISTMVSSIPSSVASFSSSIPVSMPSVTTIQSSIQSSLSSIPSTISSIPANMPSMTTIQSSITSLPSTIASLPSSIPHIPPIPPMSSIQASIAPTIAAIPSTIASIPSTISSYASPPTPSPLNLPVSYLSSPIPSHHSSSPPSSSEPNNSFSYSNYHHHVAIPAPSAPASTPPSYEPPVTKTGDN